MKIRSLIAAGTMALGGTFLAASPASAEEITCTSSLGAVTVDNLRVPDGAACVLSGTTVQGNIVVGTRARLNATSVTVVGSIQAEGARSVVVRTSAVNGAIQLDQGGSASIVGVRIGADLQAESNRGLVVARGNRITGSLQAFQNTGGVTVLNNRINGNLQCKANVPAPTGGGNVVQGSKEDQCAAL